MTKTQASGRARVAAMLVLSMLVAVSGTASGAETSAASAPPAPDPTQVPLMEAKPQALALVEDRIAPQPPALRLPEGAHPIRYDILLTLSPDEDTFTGVATILVEADKTLPLLWLNGTEITVDRASVSRGRGDDRPQSTPPAVRVVPGGESFVGFAFDPPLGAGRFTLRVEYSGKISSKEFAGLFRQKEGDDWYVFTQFESLDARRAFPCFDEPHYKVPWQLTLKIPREIAAVSNTPIEEETLEGPTRTVRFAETRPLPSYLLAIGVGPFDFVQGEPLGSKKVPFRIVTPKGQGARAKYALEKTPALLTLLESYFGSPYPYEKLDFLAIPIFGGAMENPGCVTFSRSLLLSKPEEDTPSRQRAFVGITAHELAHMWFGDLVTLDWWDDVWLNESFADWMANKVVDQWSAEFGVPVSRVRERARAMNQDSYISARRIRQPIASEVDIETAFDSITYAKGATVLDMFERWVGPDAFRRGVRRLMTQHAWKTATADDFLASLSSEAGRDVGPAFRTFLDQGGLPLVSFRLSCPDTGSPRLALFQKRYLPAGSKGSTNQTWKIPVCVRYGTGGDPESSRSGSITSVSPARPGANAGVPGRRQCLLLETPAAEVDLEGAPGCPDWILLNDGEAGYYRPRLESDPGDASLTRGENLARLFDPRNGILSEAERVGAFDDLTALVDAGEIPAGEVLALLPKVMADGSRHTVRATSGFVLSLRAHLVSPATRANYERFVRKTYGDRARKLGWAPSPNEPEETRLLRPELVALVGGAGEDVRLQKQARLLAERWLDNPKAVWPDMIGTVMSLAARHGDQAFFDRLLALAKKEKDRTRRGVLLNALAAFRDPSLVRKRLALLLGDEFDPRELRSFWGGDADQIDLRFDFVKKNYDALAAKLPERSSSRMIRIGSGYCDEAHRAEVESTFRERAATAFGGPRVLEETLEQIDLCIATRKAQQESVEKFLKKY